MSHVFLFHMDPDGNFGGIQEITNTTHVSRTPKPDYLIALVTYLGSVGKVPFNF